MPKVIFNNGVLKLDPTLDHEKKQAVFLAFHPANENHHKYDALEKSLPVIEGLKRRSHRANFAFTIMETLESHGFEIVKKQHQWT